MGTSTLNPKTILLSKRISLLAGTDGGGSPEFVITGATVKCQQGEKEATLLKTSFGNMSIGDAKIALTSEDKAIAEENFGVCKKLSKKYKEAMGEAKDIPCEPDFLEWKETETLTTLQAVETLTMKSKLGCSQDTPECIEIVESGQGKTFVPKKLEMTMKEFNENFSWSTNWNDWVDKRTGRPSAEATRWRNNYLAETYSSENFKNPTLERFKEILRTGIDPVSGHQYSDAELAGIRIMMYAEAASPFVAAFSTSKFSKSSSGSSKGVTSSSKGSTSVNKGSILDDLGDVEKKASGANIPNNSKNSAHYQKYKNELMKGDVLENSKPIISGSDLKDPKVVSELTKNGSSMSDWAKMESTYSYETSMGTGKIHYYQNLKTDEISYYDVKMKVPIPKDLKFRKGLTDDFWIIDLDNNFIPKGVR
ncbi:PAAR-like protein [Enterococcus sp. LJL90]